jgi:uncharacterized protein YqjF (DUF2071 family)
MNPEAVTPETTRAVTRSILVQRWAELTFLHWEADPARLKPLLPAGTEPDLFDGRAYVGLIAFRMENVGFFRGPGVPYLGTFCETNVRLYSVDENGHRAVVFLSLDAARLLPVLTARLSLRLPYMWAKMRLNHEKDVITYTSRRRWPAPRGTSSTLTVRTGAPIPEPSALEHFLTARWGLHTTAWGRTIHLPNEHPRWPLHHADLLHLDDNLITAAGLPAPEGPPISVLYSPGVDVKFGKPL